MKCHYCDADATYQEIVGQRAIAWYACDEHTDNLRDSIPVGFVLIPYTESRSLLAQSNRDTLLADLPSEDIHDRGSDGLYGREESEAVQEWISQLDGYPLADESDHSERESELEESSWEEYGRDDMRREMTDYLDARLRWLDHTDIDASDIIENLTDGQIDEVYRAACRAHNINGGAYCQFEEDYDGTHAHFYVSEACYGRNRRQGVWTHESWDGLVPTLAPDGKVDYTTGEPSSWYPVLDSLTPKCLRCDSSVHTDEVSTTCEAATVGSIWYADCGDPTCDLAHVALHTNARLAYEGLRGESDSIAVLADACEQACDVDTANQLRMRPYGYPRNDHTSYAFQRAALKRIATEIIAHE